MPQLEPLTARIVADVDKKSFGDGVNFALDTGKKIDQSLRKELRLNVRNAIGEVERLREQLKKTENEDARIDIKFDIKQAQREVTEFQRKLNNLNTTGDENLSRLQGKFNGIGSTLGDLSSRFLGFATVVGGAGVAIGAIGNQIATGVRDAIAFESAFTGVRKTIEATERQFGFLKQELLGLSSALGTPFEEIAKVAELAGQLGVSVDDISLFTDTVVKIAATTNITTEQAATDFARLANVLQIPLDRVEELATVTVRLGNNFATTEQEILSFTQRLSSAGGAAGFQQEELQAIATALSSLGIQAEAGGTSVSKSFIDIQSAVSQGGKELEAFAKLTGQTSEEFQSAFREDAGDTFLSVVQGISDAGEGAVTIIDDLFGSNVRTRNAFLSLAAGSDLLADSLRTANSELTTQNALQEEARKRFQTTEQILAQQREEIRATRAEIGENLVPAYILWNKAINSVSQSIGSLASFLGGGRGSALGIGRDFDDIIDGATDSAEAIGKVQEQIEIVQRNADEGVWTELSNVPTDEIQRLQGFIQDLSLEVNDGLIVSLDSLTSQFLNGQISTQEYSNKILLLQQQASDTGFALDTTSSITSQLNGVFKSLNTANSQEQLNAIKNKSLETIDSIIVLADALANLGSTAQLIDPFSAGPVSVDTTQISAAIAFSKVSDEVKAARESVASFNREFEGGAVSGGGGGGGKSARQKALEKEIKELEKAEKLKEEIRLQGLANVAKAEVALFKTVKQGEKERSEQLKESRDIYEEMGDVVEDQTKKVEDLNDEIKESLEEIADLQKEIDELNKDTSTDLASRGVEIDEEIQELQEDDDLDDSKRRKQIRALEKEKKLIKDNTTAEERAEAVRKAGLSTAEEILEQRDEELAQLEAKKIALEEETTKLQTQKAIEQDLLDNFANKQIEFEKRVTTALGVEIQERKDLYDELIQKALEAQRVGAISSSGGASSTTNNTTTNITNNVSSPEVATNLVSSIRLV